MPKGGIGGHHVGHIGAHHIGAHHIGHIHHLSHLHHHSAYRRNHNTFGARPGPTVLVLGAGTATIWRPRHRNF